MLFQPPITRTASISSVASAAIVAHVCLNMCSGLTLTLAILHAFLNILRGSVICLTFDFFLDVGNTYLYLGSLGLVANRTLPDGRGKTLYARASTPDAHPCRY